MQALFHQPGQGGANGSPANSKAVGKPILPSALAARLHVRSGEPLLLRSHTVYDNDKRPMEFAEVPYVSARFTLTLDLKEAS